MDKTVCTLFLLLFLLSIVHGEGFALAPIELAPIPCNDKAVEKLSRLAVTYINEDRTDGYKFALNRIVNVHLHAQVSTEINAQQEMLPEVVVIPCQWESGSCFAKELWWRGYFSSVITEIPKLPCKKESYNGRCGTNLHVSGAPFDKVCVLLLEIKLLIRNHSLFTHEKW